MIVPDHIAPVAPIGRTSRVAILLIVLLAGAIRLIWLDGVPPGINQDEAIHAYDAYCLLKTGMDHAGVRWPIFVHANGVFESHSAPFVYLLIPFQAVMGMNVWSTRLPAALLGISTIPLVYVMVRRWYGHQAAILAALFLAISPWHIQLSRLAYEVSICPFLFLFGLWLFVSAIAPIGRSSLDSPGRTFALLAASGLILGLTSWTYNAMRVFVPFILLAGCVIYHRQLFEYARRKSGSIAITVFALGLSVGIAPFLWAWVRTPDHAWGHAKANLILSHSADFGQAIASVLKTYALHIGPSFLFLSGDSSLAQHVSGHGQLYFLDAPLLILGLYRLATRRRSEPIGLFLLAWLVIAPIPAALTKVDGGHALRSAAALPAYQILSALGLDLLLRAARPRSPRLLRTVTVAFSLAIVGSFAVFCNRFFRVYPVLSSGEFGAVYRPIIAEIQRRKDFYDFVLVSPFPVGHVGNLFLFWSQMPPQAYFDSAKDIWVGPEWDVLVQVDKFLFVPSERLREIIDQVPPAIPRVRVLIADETGLHVPGVEILRVATADGLSFSLYDVQIERKPASRRAEP